MPSGEVYVVTTKPFELELVDVLGDDLRVVNAARISFNTEHTTLTDGDRKLIQYLAKEKHFSPFRHCQLVFRIKAPEFVLRQAFKHIVGIESTSSYPTKDSAWNEMSGRYKQYRDIYMPAEWLTQHATSKQCSAGAHDDQAGAAALYMEGIRANLESYDGLIRKGVSREQARMLLPLTFMTEVLWTGSLQAVHNFVVLRDSEHAQLEIRLLAQQMAALAREKFPIAFGALFD